MKFCEYSPWGLCYKTCGHNTVGHFSLSLILAVKPEVYPGRIRFIGMIQAPNKVVVS
jgi:hypothetical protein